MVDKIIKLMVLGLSIVFVPKISAHSYAEYDVLKNTVNGALSPAPYPYPSSSVPLEEPINYVKQLTFNKCF